MIKLLIIGLCFILSSIPAYAEKVCLKTIIKKGKAINSTKVVADNLQCPKGFKQLFQTSEVFGAATVSTLKGEVGPQGATGPQGNTGEDGSLRIYGDASSGDLIVTSNRLMTDPEITAQFNNCSIESGVVFEIPAGVTIRCRGSFINKGTINILPGGGLANGGFSVFFTTPTQAVAPNVRSAVGAMGLGAPAGNGIFSASGGLTTGGRADNNTISTKIALSVRDPLYAFGGSGAAGLSLNGSANTGGAGGGGFLVLAKEGITNEGTISANGGNAISSGAGGGAAGSILLASPAFVVNSELGTITAKGGNGGNASASVGFGGAGGGGLIHFISPTVTTGITDLSGGLSGTVAAGLTPNTTRSGGGAGGSSLGSGSFGGSIRADNTYVTSLNGLAGKVIVTNEDPTSLF